VTACCRYLLGATFLMAGVSKVTDLPAFEGQVLQQTRYLPPPLALGVAAILPWVELTCGFCLVIGFAVREAALCTFFLLLLFLGHFLLGPEQMACACLLSPLPEPSAAAWWPPTRDAVLVLCSLRVAWCP
jgi:uncharacterized membrane protein YphA (DoxX/SURF4 family)